MIINEFRGISRGNEIVFSAVSASLAAASIAVIVNRLRRPPGRLGCEPLPGALSVYLLIGLFYTYLYVLAGDIRNDGFSRNLGRIRQSRILYFSFVTPHDRGIRRLFCGERRRQDDDSRRSAGRVSSISSPVVAIVIGNIGRSRSNRPNDPD